MLDRSCRCPGSRLCKINDCVLRNAREETRSLVEEYLNIEFEREGASKQNQAKFPLTLVQLMLIGELSQFREVLKREKLAQVKVEQLKMS